MGTPGIDEQNVHQHLLKLTERDVDQVFTLHAELEGALFASVFERLLHGWMAQGHRVGTLGQGFATLSATSPLPEERLTWGSVAGRSGQLVVSD